MNHETRSLSTGQTIHIYDGLFDACECEHYNKFAQDSLYRCGFNSSSLFEHMTFSSLTSMYNDNDVQRFGLFNSKNYDKVSHHFQGMKREASWMTLVKLMPELYYHCDDNEPDTMTLLYYVNLDWNINYGGETIICNSSGDPEIAIATRPNRLIVYNSNLMHKPSGLSPKSHPNRYTFVSVFK
jgi:hypothetical protein